MLPNKCSRSLEEKSMRRFEQPGLGTGLPGLPSTARVGTLLGDPAEGGGLPPCQGLATAGSWLDKRAGRRV